MPVILKNNAFSTLATAITASDTAIVVADGSKFPALSAGEYFYATLVSPAGTTEIVKVTARVSNSLTVVRAQDGSSAASFQVGALVEMRANAASIAEISDEASEVSIVDAGGHYTATDVEGALQEAAVYNQGGVGAVTRTVQSRLRDFVSVKDFGAVGDGVADDTAAIQKAIDVAAALANSEFPVVVSLSSGNYGISSALNMNDADFVALEAGGLVAIGSKWSATDPILTMTTPLADDLKSCGLRHVYIDCKHLCAGVLLKNTKDAFLDYVHVTHAKTYHIKAETKNTELNLTSCIVNQWFYGEVGFNTIANRTAYGFWIDCADTKLIGCTGYYCLEPLRGTGGNAQISACHFYNGATVDGTDNINIHLYGARGYMITDCYIDNGIVKITGGSTTGVSGTEGDEFNHTITGIVPGPGGAGNITTSVELIAVDPNETAEGLRVDLLLRGLSAGVGFRQSTSGSGSWTNLKARINLVDRDGNARAYGKAIVPDGTSAAPGLVFSSEADTNTGLYRTAPDQIGFACNGSGIAFFSPNGLEAGSSGVGWVGSPSSPFASTHSTVLRITDGTANPSTISGYAAIYVSSTDGDLKVKFSDGTVKTIVTDT